MCTVKDLKLFLAERGMTVGQTRSLIYKMLDNLDAYQDENKYLIDNRNNYKGKGITFEVTKKETTTNAYSSNSSRYH